MSLHPLAAWMKSHGVSQSDLASRASTHQSVISSVVTGKRTRFSPDVAKRIRAATGGALTLDQLLFPPRRSHRAA